NAILLMDAEIHELTMRAAGYHRFPTEKLCEVLRWRNADGWPTLASFSIFSAECRFAAAPEHRYATREWPSRHISDGLPKTLAPCYDDVFAALEARAGRRGRDMQLRVAFAGTLPPDVRTRIVAARSRFSQIAILAEVAQWQLEEREIPRIDMDPLVLGFTPTDECWIIATFDLTPVEELVRDIAEGKRVPRG
ncbi:MAG: hypothetical protein V1723_00255, partial [Candidatus Uhrbacteria bacterium]